MVQGGEIIWVCRDYTNATTVWSEIKKRFANKPGFHVSEQHRTVTLREGGYINVVSAENIDSIRGGAWDGCVVDEAAHQDLAVVFWNVVRPGLADREGWAIFMSTTKPGSYFNQLCEEVLEGSREDDEDEWRCSHYTAFDNPVLDPKEIQKMVNGYLDDVKLKCEVFAELIVPGGLAFREWDTSVHTFTHELPEMWPLVACLDWGYARHGWFGLAGCGPDLELWFRYEHYFKEKEPYDVGFTVGTVTRRFPPPHYIVADSQMFARVQSESSMADHFQKGLNKAYEPDDAPALIPSPKGPGSRERGVVAMHTALKWKPGEDPSKLPKHWHLPRLRFHTDCANAIRTIPKLPRDENNSDDVDTKAEDHPFDAIKGLLLFRYPQADKPDVRPDEHPEQARVRRKMNKWRKRFGKQPEPELTYPTGYRTEEEEDLWG